MDRKITLLASTAVVKVCSDLYVAIQTTASCSTWNLTDLMEHAESRIASDVTLHSLEFCNEKTRASSMITFHGLLTAWLTFLLLFISFSDLCAHVHICTQYPPAEDYIPCLGWDCSSSCRVSFCHIKWLIFKQHPWLPLLQYLSVATSLCFSEDEL